MGGGGKRFPSFAEKSCSNSSEEVLKGFKNRLKLVRLLYQFILKTQPKRKSSLEKVF